MNFFQKLKLVFNKQAEVTGGLDLLKRLIAPEMSNTNYLQQYGKSLYVFACVSKIAQKVASIEPKMYKILNSRGETKEILTHPALDLIYKVNPYETKTEFLENTMINLKTTGDAFWWKIRNKGGRVVELWNLRPDLMTIVPDPETFIKQYEFVKADGTKEIFPPEDIVHFKKPNPLSLYFGMTPLKPAQYRLQTEEYMTRYQRDFFLNNARPDAVIKNPKIYLTKDQKEDIRDGFEKRHRGVGKNSKLAILEGGLEYQLISLNQKDMDYIESLKFTRDDILVAFGVPKPIVAVTDDVNRANAETAMFIFLSEVIAPEMKMLMEKINEEMIYPDFGEEFYMDFVDPTPANRELELRENSEGIQNNYLLINEVRQREGLAPLKGGWSFYMPLMNTPMGGLPQADQSKSKQKMGIIVGAENKQRAYEIQPTENKNYEFRGRFWLKAKFEIKESMEQAVIKSLKTKKKKIKGKKVFSSLIKDEELKKLYGEMVIKTIDRRTNRMKDAISDFAMEQKDRVLEKLKDIEPKKEVNKKFSIRNIFSKSKENSLAVKFALPFIEEFLKTAAKEALEIIAPQEDFNSTDEIEKRIKERAEFFGETINQTTVDKLADTLSEGISAGEGIRELSDRVEEVYGDFPAYRSELIARTEATHANNEGFVEGYRQSGVTNAKEWIATLDDRTRDSHADINGEIVGLDDRFSNGLDYPGGDGPAEEVINCRCVLGPAFSEE